MSDFVSRLVEAVSKGLSRKKSDKRNKYRGRSYARLRLEALEDRVVPSYVWSPNVATGSDYSFNTPGNWLNTSTGMLATTAPDINTDCVFSATSPTVAPCHVDGGLCRSITTDPNWSGEIQIGANSLYVFGGASTINGGNITNTNAVTGRSSGGYLDIHGGSFDYNAPGLDQNVAGTVVPIPIYINDNATFTVDKGCYMVNAQLGVGTNTDGTDNPGTLVFNTITPGSNYVTSGSLRVSSQGTLVYNPGAHGRTQNNSPLTSLGTVLIGDNVNIPYLYIAGGVLKTAGAGAAHIDYVEVDYATLQMNSDHGNYFQLDIPRLIFGDGSTFEYHVNGERLSYGNTITTVGMTQVMGTTTSLCKTDGATLLSGTHNYTPLSMTAPTSLFTGTFTNTLWDGDLATVWQATYSSAGFSLSGTVAPPPPAFHSYLWSPGPNTDSLWNTASNWFDQTTGATATSAPNDHTDVNFNAASAWEYCRINSTANCRSIHVASGPNHLIDLSGGTLQVFGLNGADSDIEGGEIDCVISAGKLLVDGGNFTYNTTTLNHPFVQPSNLLVEVFDGADFITGPACLTTYNTSYAIGGSFAPGEVSQNGTLTINSTNPAANYNFTNSSIFVSSTGTLTFAPFASLNNASITSYGNVILNNGDMLRYTGSTPSGLMIEGGTLQDTGIGYIQGNVLVYNAAISMVDNLSNAFSMLVVNGNLTMINGTYNFSVIANSPLSDRIVAGGITLFGICTSDCNTVGTPTPGSSSLYTPMISYTGQILGTFTTYNWLGTGTIWTPKYVGGQYQLTN